MFRFQFSIGIYRSLVNLSVWIAAASLMIGSCSSADELSRADSGVGNKLADAEQRLKESQALIEGLQTDSRKLRAERDKLSAQMEFLEEHIRKMDMNADPGEAGQAEEIERLRASYAELTADSRSKQGALNDAEGRTSMLKARIAQLEEDNRRLTAEMEALHASGKTEPVKSGEEADRLNALVASLRRENSDLETEIVQLRDVVRQMRETKTDRADGQDAEPSIDPRLAEAQDLFERGALNKAQALFSEVADQFPDNLEANLGLAYCYYQKSLYNEALKIAEDISNTHPEQPDVHRLKGLSAWRCGDLDLASESFQRAIELDAGEAALHNYLGVVKFSQGDFESARRQFVLAVELDDQLVEANYNLAVLYSTPEKNDLEKARQYYERAIQLGRMKNEGLEKKIY